MNFYKFYSFLFSKSFDVVREFKKIKKPQNFINKQKEYNLLINEFILKNGTRYYSNNQKINNQFFVDSLNEFFLNHLNKRIAIYNMSNFLGKRFFQFLSFLQLFKFALRKILMGFSHNLNIFSLNNYKIDSKDIIACIGFPSHAYAYQENQIYPSSFIEYLIINNKINKDTVLLSLDEYARPSKVKKENIHSSYFNRIIINKKRELKNLFKIPKYIFKSFLEYRRKFKNKNLLLFFYFYEKYSKANLIQRLIDSSKKNKIKLKEFYFLNLYDIGLLKYDDSFTNFYYYSYSQNEFTPPSENIYNVILNKNYNYDLKTILKEITFNVFSMHSHKQINLTSHLNFLNNLIEEIRNKYEFNLQRYQLLKSYTFNSNLGYENIKNIKLNLDKKNILLFDLPIESYEFTMERQFTGDYFGTEGFILEFFEEIIKLLSSYDVELYIKPKYSFLGTRNHKLYSSMINDISNKNLNITMIDPYDKIELAGKKFDLLINMPYVSTLYTLRDLSQKIIYYIPKDYNQNFKITSNKIVMGYNELNNFLKT